MIVLQANKKRLRRLAFSPDGRLLAAVGEAGTVLLWDVTSRQAGGPSRLPDRSLRRLCFTPASRSPFVSGPEGQWRWRVAGGEATPVPRDGSGCYSLALSPGGDRLVARHIDVACYPAERGAA